MNHWQAIAIAYGFTALALVAEMVLLRHRRRRAERQLKESAP